MTLASFLQRHACRPSAAVLLLLAVAAPSHAQWDPLRTTAAVTPAEREAVDADYLQKARAYIERIRKSDARVRVTDAQGRPVPGARVWVDQVSQDFLFGNLAEDQFNEGWSDAERARFTSLFTGLFNYTELTLVKWQRYEPEQGKPLKAALQQQLDWAAANGITVKGHTLGWTHNAGTPRWLYTVPPTERLAAYDRHLQQFVSDYRGRLPSYDVVNEAVNTVPMERALQDMRGDGQIDDGPRYDTRGVTVQDLVPRVERSFRIAHAADPSAQLHINEYNLLSRREVRQRYMELIRLLLDRKVPVQGIGIQAHEPHTMWFATPEIVKAFDQLAAFGLPLRVTEFIPQSSGRPITGGWREGRWTEDAQAEFAVQFYTLAFGHPAMKSIHWWGLSERSIWLPGGGLLDAALNPKPVYHRLQQLIRHDWMTHDLSLATDAQGDARFRGFHGRYRVVVTTPDGTTRDATVHVRDGGDNEVRVTL